MAKQCVAQKILQLDESDISNCTRGHLTVSAFAWYRQIIHASFWSLRNLNFGICFYISIGLLINWRRIDLSHATYNAWAAHDIE